MRQEIMNPSQQPPKQAEQKKQDHPDPNKSETEAKKEGDGTVEMSSYVEPMKRDETTKFGADKFK